VRPQEGGEIVCRTVFQGVREVVPGFHDPVGECEPPILIVRGGLLQPGVAGVVAPQHSPVSDDARPVGCPGGTFGKGEPSSAHDWEHLLPVYKVKMS
jgi:hypothetical protein